MRLPQELFLFPFPSMAHESFNVFLSSLTLVILLICLSIWASQRCSGKRIHLLMQEMQDTQVRS